MDTQSLVETLKDAGLSPYQANTYVALLELGVASATEVAEAAEVPPPRIYDVLRSLESDGYIETYEQDSLRARAHDPSDVLEELRGRAERLKAAAEEVERRWDQPEIEDTHASIVTRFRTVLERARRFITESSHQLHLSTTAENYRRLRSELRAASERGVSVRVSVHTDPDEEPPDPAEFEGVCLEVRHRPLPAAFVLLADRRRACFAHHPDAVEQYGVIVADRTHTYVFYWYFLTTLWDPWETVYRATPSDLPREYMDVRHLVGDVRSIGHTDHDIRVRAEGYDTDTGKERELTGRVADLEFVPQVSTEAHPFEMVGQVSLTLETDAGEHVTVGGWGAILEEVEAIRLTLLEVEPPVDFSADDRSPF